MNGQIVPSILKKNCAFVFIVTQTKKTGLFDPEEAINAIIQNKGEPSPKNTLSHHSKTSIFRNNAVRYSNLAR